jgi:hypothetical protein
MPFAFVMGDAAIPYLWDSYNFAVSPVSKTYARGGTSSPEGEGRWPAETSAQEQSMLDIILIALGLGFFALAIGYGYACERL